MRGLKVRVPVPVCPYHFGQELAGSSTGRWATTPLLLIRAALRAASWAGVNQRAAASKITQSALAEM